MEEATVEVSAVFEQAKGVLAERLCVDVDSAGSMIERVALREGSSRDAVAADVIASSCEDFVHLPRAFYANGDDSRSAA